MNMHVVNVDLWSRSSFCSFSVTVLCSSSASGTVSAPASEKKVCHLVLDSFPSAGSSRIVLAYRSSPSSFLFILLCLSDTRLASTSRFLAHASSPGSNVRLGLTTSACCACCCWCKHPYACHLTPNSPSFAYRVSLSKRDNHLARCLAPRDRCWLENLL